MGHHIKLETYFAGLLQKVELQIQEYEDTAMDTLTLCRLSVDYLQEILGELKAFIVSYPFASPEEEIHHWTASLLSRFPQKYGISIAYFTQKGKNRFSYQRSAKKFSIPY